MLGAGIGSEGFPEPSPQSIHSHCQLLLEADWHASMKTTHPKSVCFVNSHRRCRPNSSNVPKCIPDNEKLKTIVQDSEIHFGAIRAVQHMMQLDTYLTCGDQPHAIQAVCCERLQGTLRSIRRQNILMLGHNNGIIPALPWACRRHLWHRQPTARE